METKTYSLSKMLSSMKIAYEVKQSISSLINTDISEPTKRKKCAHWLCQFPGISSVRFAWFSFHFFLYFKNTYKFIYISIWRREHYGSKCFTDALQKALYSFLLL